MIKFGFRESLLFPSLFVLFLALRRIIKYFLENYVLNDKKVSFLLVFIMFLFEIIISSIFIFFRNFRNKSGVKSQFMGIALNENSETSKALERPDSNLKIIILTIFAAYFEIVGAISRRYLTDSETNSDIYDEFHAKYRSSEIFIASILCYFTLKIKIYKHQIFSLIIILVCLIIVFGTELIVKENLWFNLLITLISSTCRAFLDTIEKYLFDTNFIDIFKITLFEGIVDLIFSSCLYLFNKPQNELRQLFKLETKKFYIALILLTIYAILSGFKNINRRYTVKLYSPMTRALFESILDPFFIIYGFSQDKNKEDKNSLILFIVTLICSIIMVFCSCIYNEIFVLFCFGLEEDTHLHVSKVKNLELSEAEVNTNLEEEEEENQSVL